MTLDLLMLAMIPGGLILATILLRSLPDKAGDLARLQQIRDRQDTRQDGKR